MKKDLKIIFLLLLMSLSLFLTGCKKDVEKTKKDLESEENIEEENKGDDEEKKLIVYSGAGLKKPMTEIAEVYKEDKGVDIEYIFAGSAQLLSQIELSGKGDVFIVGSINAYESAIEKDLVGDYKTVAYHNPIIGVPEGNPANIKSLEDMTKEGIKVILGDEDANAIGATSQKLIKENNLEGINNNVVSKTATVNELIVHLKAGDADAAIVTEDAAFGNDDIELIEIPEDINIKQILPIGMLNISKNKEVANDFINFVSSDEGKEIFEKYGFPPVKE